MVKVYDSSEAPLIRGVEGLFAGGGGGGGTDPYWDNVTLLLHFDGTDGDDYTHIVDSSTNSTDVVSAGGTPLLKSSAAKFGDTGLQLDYNNTANNFPSCYLVYRPPAEMGLDFGTGDFTMEGWARSTIDIDAYTALMGNWSAFKNGTWHIGMTNNADGNTFFVDIEGMTAMACSSDISALGYFYFAISRNGDTLRVFLNGVMEASSTGWASVDVGGAGAFNIGQSASGPGMRWRGYLDEFRVTKGVGRYNSDDDIEVPTGPFYSPPEGIE